PIYLVGESIGGCLALAAAARTPHIDLVLVFANPGEELITAIDFINVI
ncbi:acyltransferase-like protein, chloroplastic isoform X1, partial [Tanacetum coccineum]